MLSDMTITFIYEIPKGIRAVNYTSQITVGSIYCV